MSRKNLLKIDLFRSEYGLFAKIQCIQYSDINVWQKNQYFTVLYGQLSEYAIFFFV